MKSGPANLCAWRSWFTGTFAEVASTTFVATLWDTDIMTSG